MPTVQYVMSKQLYRISHVNCFQRPLPMLPPNMRCCFRPVVAQRVIDCMELAASTMDELANIGDASAERVTALCAEFVAHIRVCCSSQPQILFTPQIEHPFSVYQLHAPMKLVAVVFDANSLTFMCIPACAGLAASPCNCQCRF